MPDFAYKARDAQGTTRAGTIQSGSTTAAAHELRGRGWIVVDVRQKADQRSKSAAGEPWLPAMGPRGIHVELSLQQIAVMLGSGMTLLASLTAVTDQTNSRALRAIWQNVIDQIQEGASLSKAMGKHDCFPAYAIQLVGVGEQTGMLETVLRRAAKTMQRRREASTALVTAMFYPVLIVVLSLAVAIYMVVYLIPRLEVYLTGLGKELPAMTQNLMDASNWLRMHYVGLLALALTLTLVAIFVYWSQAGRLWIDRTLLRIPLIGRLLRLNGTSTFARSLSILIRSGITLLDGLGTVEKLLRNRFLAQSVRDSREKIIQGSSLAEALPAGGFTAMSRQMAAVGEQSGNLEEVLFEVAEFHDSQFRSAIERLNALVTPVVTIVIGGIVGYIYIAFFVALFAAGV